MRAEDLDFSYPKELIATEPSRPSRVAFVRRDGTPREINIFGLLAEMRAGDLLVINETMVVPARVFSQNNVEILFLRNLEARSWEVLFPARDLSIGDKILMPEGVELTLAEKGLPQKVKTSRTLDTEYFSRVGEVALPPYIQEARRERRSRAEDREWYQSAWACRAGSVAAPTASLHFQPSDIRSLGAKGVKVARVTLHVGAGTFLPIRAANLKEHVMHSEWAEIPASTVDLIKETKERGDRVWALGTTVTRSLESMAHGLLREDGRGGFHGDTKLFIYPPFEFKIIDVLMTNFHQPKSTLLGLVAAFAGLERAKAVYAWAIQNRFKLFSYGDLSVWMKP